MDTKPKQILIVLRHGDSDAVNGLTPLGEAEVKAAANGLKSAKLIPDLIVTSHPLRAKKTTNILRQEFATAVLNIDHDLLNISDEMFDTKNLLSSFLSGMKTVLLSGHGETITFFANQFLDNHDCAALFKILPSNRFIKTHQENSNVMTLMPKTADALILQKDESGTWRLYGWLADGQINLKQNNAKGRIGTKTNDPYLLSYTIPAV